MTFLEDSLYAFRRVYGASPRFRLDHSAFLIPFRHSDVTPTLANALFGLSIYVSMLVGGIVSIKLRCNSK